MRAIFCFERQTCGPEEEAPLAFDSSKVVKAYILSVGGFLGMGTYYVSVEPDAVKIKYDDNDKKWHANMNATKDDLKAAPDFNYEGRWKARKT